MVLVDTSIWVDHFSVASEPLAMLLANEEVNTHPMVIGELACGGWAIKDEIYQLMNGLPKIEIAEDHEVFQFIKMHRLHGKGVGWVDMHLLVSAKLSRAELWTRDKHLLKLAQQFSLNFEPLS